MQINDNGCVTLAAFSGHFSMFVPYLILNKHQLNTAPAPHTTLAQLPTYIQAETLQNKKGPVRQVKTQISLSVYPVCKVLTERVMGNWGPNPDTGRQGWFIRLGRCPDIWESVKCIGHLLVLLCYGSFSDFPTSTSWENQQNDMRAQRRLRSRMPRLIWVFAGHTLILLVFSCRGSYRGIILSYFWVIERFAEYFTYWNYPPSLIWVYTVRFMGS